MGLPGTPLPAGSRPPCGIGSLPPSLASFLSTHLPPGTLGSNPVLLLSLLFLSSPSGPLHVALPPARPCPRPLPAQLFLTPGPPCTHERRMC